MSQAKIGFDEWLEPDRIKRRPQLAKRPAHKAEVDPAHDVTSFACQSPERAATQPNGLVRVHPVLGRETDLLEQVDKPLDTVGGGWRGLASGSHGPTPTLTGTRGRANRIITAGKLGR